MPLNVSRHKLSVISVVPSELWADVAKYKSIQDCSVYAFHTCLSLASVGPTPIFRAVAANPGSLMIGVVILSRKHHINPDNVAIPIAASLGDITTLALLAGSGSLLFNGTGELSGLSVDRQFYIKDTVQTERFSFLRLQRMSASMCVWSSSSCCSFHCGCS